MAIQERASEAPADRHPSVSLADEEVVERVRAGETALYGILMHRYHKRLYAITRGILQNDAEVEDAMQEAHVHALTHIHQFAGRSSFYTWLTRITINEAFTRLRGQPRFQNLDLPGSGGTAPLVLVSGLRDPEQQTLNLELRIALEVALDTLPDRYRKVFLAREIDEMSTSQAARTLGLSEECVKTRLFRAKNLLRRAFHQYMKPAKAKPFRVPDAGLLQWSGFIS